MLELETWMNLMWREQQETTKERKAWCGLVRTLCYTGRYKVEEDEECAASPNQGLPGQKPDEL